MADIQVARPEAGAEVRVPAEQGASFVLDFPVEDLLTGAKDGSNLVLQTNDGGNVVIENFYDTFNADEKPQFVVDGNILESKDFFTGNLDSSLDPAAGPAAGPTVANGGRYRDYTNAALATGIDHLTRLDYNSDRGFEWDDSGWITRPDDDGYLLGQTGGVSAGLAGAIPPVAPINHPVSIVPDHPWMPDPNVPEFPGDPNNPWNPDGPNMDVNAPRSAVRVHEKNIGTPDAVQEESFIINAPDGVGSIKIGNVVVWENGSLVPEADRTFPTDEGKLTITGFDPDTGRLTYTFELTNPTDEHTKPGEDSISHSFKVTVTDTDGDTASSYITVVIEDDIPEASDDFDKVNEGETVSGSVIVNDDHGKDGPGTFGEDGPAVRWEIPENAESSQRVVPEDGGKPYYEVETPEGTAKLYDDGSYDFTGKDIDETTDVSFGYTIVDSDGDEAKATLTITVVANTPTITPEVPEPDPTPDPTPDPDDPDPKPIPSTPSGESGKIVVDEGAMAGGTGGDGHGASGVGLIGVNLNGDSKGTIQIGDATLNIEGGKLVGFEETEAATVDGVKVVVTGASFNSVTGKWDVSYKYELVEAQKHNYPDKSGAEDTITGGKIDITVTDASGDVATGQLTVEVHDDAPQVGVVEKTQTVVINMGADVNDAQDQIAQVFLKGSDTPLEWFSQDGKAEVGNDIDFMVNGTYVSGNIVMVKDNNGYHFKVSGDATEDVELVVRATDADKDTAETPVKLTVPTVTPQIPVPKDPEPENPDNPVTPSGKGGKIIVDESAMPGGTGKHTEHGAAGTGVITVDLKDDTEGSIQVGDATLNIKGGNLVGFEETEAGTVDGVQVVVTGASFNAETGKWDVSYKYELVEAQEHDYHDKSGAEDTITGGKIDITVTDATGDVATGKLTIEVHDDAPEVSVEKQTVTIAMGADKGGSDKVEVILEDNVLKWSNDDFSDVTDVNDLPVGEYESGNFVLAKNEDGSYSFRFKDGSDKDVTLQVKATDRDGDSDSENVTLKAPTITPEIPQIPDPDNKLVPLPDAGNGQIIVDEAAMEGASGKDDGHGAAGQGVITVDLRGDSEGVITVGDAVLIIKDNKVVDADGNPVTEINLSTGALVNGVAVTVTGAELKGDKWEVSYEYELKVKQDHADPENPVENPNVTNTTITGGSIPVSVTDADGDVATGNLTIEVHDDVPEVFVDKQTVTIAMGADKGGSDKVEVFPEGETDFPMAWKTEGSNEIKGSTDIDSLAPGRYESGGVIMIKSEDGKYTFKLKDVSSDEDPRADVTLTVKATDSDGDVAPKEVVLKYPTIEPQIPQIPKPDPENPGSDDPLVKLPDAGKGQIIVDEAAMSGGSHAHDDHGAAGKGIITVDLKGDSEGVITVGDAVLTIKDNKVVDADGNPVTGINLSTGALVNGVAVTVTGAELKGGKWEVSYEYKLETAQTHPDDKASGENDKITGGKIEITVTDADGDVSTGKLTIEVHDDAPVLNITENNTYNGKLELSFGADDKYQPSFDADGQPDGHYFTATMGEDNVQAVEADGVYTFEFTNGDILTVTPEGAAYSYDFKPANGTDVTYSKEPVEIKLKATDSDKDVAEATIKVGENKAPTISVPPTQKADEITEEDPKDLAHAPYNGNATIVVDEGALANGTGQHIAHGASGEGHLVVGVHGEPGGYIELEFGGRTHTINLPTDFMDGQDSKTLEPPVEINVNGLTVTFNELVLEKGTSSAPLEWQLNYSYKYDPNSRHEHDEDHDRVDNDKANVGSIKVTVIDGIGGDKAEGEITIEIHDDVPMVNTSEVTGSETSGAVQKTLNFVTPNGKDIEGGPKFTDSDLGDAKWDKMGFTDAAGKVWDNGQNGFAVGMTHGIQIFSSSVQYYYNQEGGVWYLDRVEDRHGDYAKQIIDEDGNQIPKSDWNDTANIGGRNPLHMTSDGLSIKHRGDANWGGDDAIGTKPNESKDNTDFGTHAGMSHAAEALVLENYSNLPSYGLNIEFGKFDAGDKAVITFYLTPTSSNDDTVVYTKIISYGDLTPAENGKGHYINIAVPDGFTKVIVSPLPGGTAFNEPSDFTIRQVGFTRPAYSYEGTATFAAGQDGIDGSLTWDWDNVISALNSSKVEITNTIGHGTYSVQVGYDNGDHTTIKATISGEATSGKLNGQTLFEGKLNADGTWTVTQFYNFKVDGKEPVFDFKFSITDRDGDVITADQKLDMSKPVIKDRFDEHQDGLWSFGSGLTIDHHEYDYLVGKVDDGHELNDLMYGREGNDVMFGDNEGGKALAHLNTVLKTDVTLEDISEAKGPDGNATSDSHANNGTTNKDGFETLQKALFKAAADGDLNEKLTQLEGLQGKDGGDDALFGGAGSDILIGGSGDDYLFGNGKENTYVDGGLSTDRDILLGGAGNDIIVYGKNDYIIDGGSDIDFLLAGKDDNLSLANLPNDLKVNAKGNYESGQYVNGIEVLITALHTSDVSQLGITSLKSLANYGVRLIGEGKDQILELGPDWHRNDDGSYSYNNGQVSLRLETSLMPMHNQLVLKDTSEADIHRADGGTGSDVLFGYNVANVAGEAGLLTVLGLQSGASQEAIAAAIKANPEAVADYLAAHGGGEVEKAYSNSVGGAGDDYLFGQNFSDGLMGDADLKKDIIGLLKEGSDQNKDAFEKLETAYDDHNHDALVKFGTDLEENVESKDTRNDGNDMLFAGGGDDLVYGGGGNDVLMGGAGEDILIGGSGDDYLNGGEGSDYLYGGSGNDIIVFDKDDYVIDGGSGIDILIAGQDGKDETLEGLLNSQTGPVVNNIDVFIKGIDPNTMGLTDMDKLASELGIRIDDKTLHLEGWKKLDEQGGDGIGVYAKGNMILETSLPDQQVQLESPENLALQQAQHEVANGNG